MAFHHSPKEVQWDVTQPKEGQNSLYLCKTIPLPASLYPGHFTAGDYMPGAFSCSQPALPDSKLTKGVVDILNLLSPLEKDASFTYLGKQKRPFSDKLSLQDQGMFLWLIKLGPVSPCQFGPCHLFQFRTPYLRIVKLRRAWEHDGVRRDAVKTKAWRPMQWRVSQEFFLPQGQTFFLGLVLTPMECETDAREHYWKAKAEGFCQSATNPLQKESHGLPAYYC